ncbi:MAG: beta-lactamase family protein, partial [Lachnospiraceae bacterium]|nr:beta-lactamase family protein [Lachnospiraceae bacterium]
MAVSVFDKEKSLYTNYFGYADKEAGIAVDHDMVIEWGSVTKLLVWVSVMQLWEQGQLELNRDIRDYLPEGFLSNLSYDTPVTMENLMNHNAGFQDVYADMFVKEHAAIGTLETSLKAHEPAQIYEPGEVTAYSNWGVALAGFIVERVSGESFDAYVHRHIFEPLLMEHSALSPDLSDNAYVKEKRKELQCYSIDGVLLPDCFYYLTIYPAGMCTSTLEDFETFGKALLDEASPLFEKRETYEFLFTPTLYYGDSDIPANCHGLWVEVYGVESVGHGGNSRGCSSKLLLDLRSGIGAVVMTNQYGETVYNSKMMELIFGKFSEEQYFDAPREEPEGVYCIARTVREGPFKLISLYHMFSELEPGQFWVAANSGSTEKLCFPYTDCVRVPSRQYIPELTLVFLWLAVLLFTVVSLLVKLVRSIVRRCKKQDNRIPMGRWSACAAIVQAVLVPLLVWMALCAASYKLSSSYLWGFILVGILTLVMAGLAIYGIAALRKTDCSKKRRFYNLITVLSLAVTVVNILYWNLFMFWYI